MKLVAVILLFFCWMELARINDHVKHIDTVLSAPPQGEK